MARIEIELPNQWAFRTEIPVRIDDINFGGHLGHDSIVTLIHEARARFFAAHGWRELDVAGAGIIMADLAVQYLSEAFYSDILIFEITARDFSSKGCDLVYRLSAANSNREVARAKTGIVFFDYEARIPVEVPATFRSLFE